MDLKALRGGNRDFRDLAQLALAQGWEINKTNGGHLRWKAPAGALIFSASTPSDRRAVANLRSQLRRAGLTLP